MWNPSHADTAFYVDQRHLEVEPMPVKEYLNTARYLDRQIDVKLDHLSRLNSIIYKATATLSDMPGSPNRDVTRRERAIAKVVDLQKEIDEEIDRLVDMKRELNEFINKISSKHSLSLIIFGCFVLYLFPVPELLHCL